MAVFFQLLSYFCRTSLSIKNFAHIFSRNSQVTIEKLILNTWLKEDDTYGKTLRQNFYPSVNTTTFNLFGIESIC